LADVTHFVFIDCETTGLDPNTSHLIEVAALAIDVRYPFEEPLFEMSEVVNVAAAIGTGELGKHLGEADEWICNTHCNGLIGMLFAGVASLRCAEEIEDDLAVKIKALGPKKGIQIAGNSPSGVDLPFLRARMPKVLEACSHHVVDVSGLARQLRYSGFPVSYAPGTTESVADHRALDDAKHSLQTWRTIHRALNNFGCRENERLRDEERRRWASKPLSVPAADPSVLGVAV